MSLDADAIVDRRRLRRKLTFWRVGALVIVAAGDRRRRRDLRRPAAALDAARRLHRAHHASRG